MAHYISAKIQAWKTYWPQA